MRGTLGGLMMTYSNRQNFDSQLQEVKENLLKMGILVEESLAKAILSLKETNLPMAQAIVQEDKLVNQMEQDIDMQVTTLIARQQPVASDLRKLISAIRIASDLE